MRMWLKLKNCVLLGFALMCFDGWAISAPSITSCTRPSSTSVKVSWTSVSGASYYVVKRSYTSSVSSALNLTTTTSTSYTDSTAGADTCYYWVEAWDSSGSSARSSMATASSGSSGGSSGGSFTINASDGTSTEGVVITWTAQSGATGYRVVRGTSSDMDYASILVETTTGTSYTDTTAVAGKKYYYWIVAKKSSGYVTSSYNTGYRASSSSGGGDSGSDDDPISYTVVFNANGGMGSMADESFVYGTAKSLTINTFTRVGYTFIGWAASASATTSTYDDGQSVMNLTTTSGGTVTLYAVWQANAYTVKFNANGGTGAMSDLSMTYGTEKALTSNAFQRANYTFVGWSTTPDATGTTFSDGQSVINLTSCSDTVVKLYAVWTLTLEVATISARQRYPWNGYVDIDMTFRASGLSTVSFAITDVNGGTNLNAKTFYLGNPENKVRTLDVHPGTHRFVWDAAADLGQVVLPSFVVTAMVREKFFNVSVTGGTGTGTYVEESSVSLSADSKPGYTFTRWNGSMAATKQLANAEASDTTLAIPAFDVAYQAVYTPNTYTVKFNANGGSGTMAYESFTYDTEKALTANAFTRNGFTFLGWAESATATAATYTDKQSVRNLVTAGVKNLYAVWDCPLGVQLWDNGPYWAKCNLGTTTPEGTGYYFMWGDVVGYQKVGSSWDAVDGSVTGFSFERKNCPKYLAYLSKLTAEEDAASVHWGLPWRMPTTSECEDLWSNTTQSRVSYNGVAGYRFTGKGDYSTKSIFIPSVGYVDGTTLRKYHDATSSGASTTAPTRGWIFWCSNIVGVDSRYSGLFYYATEETSSGSYRFAGVGTTSTAARYLGLQIRPLIGVNE